MVIILTFFVQEVVVSKPAGPGYFFKDVQVKYKNKIIISPGSEKDGPSLIAYSHVVAAPVKCLLGTPNSVQNQGMKYRA